jgi:uncharacterized protein with HEPN domain
MVEAIERVRGIVGAVSLEAFEEDWQRQWMVQRGVEIVSEASRHLTDELKSRHPNIPWTKVAGSATSCATATKAYRRQSYGNWSDKTCGHWKRSVARS